MAKVEVNTKGIKNRLKTVKPSRAISEYIWNGFDAGATLVEIIFDYYELGTIINLSLADNGSGIKRSELDKKFVPVLASETKHQEEENTLVHGKNGMGRLTFFQISQKVHFRTIYKSGEEYFSYIITIDSSNLHNFLPTEELKSDIKETGTVVDFVNINQGISIDIMSEIMDFLKKEFCIFLEIKKPFGFAIKINNEYLNYSDMISGDREEEISFACGKYSFTCDYIRWNKKPNDYSRYYCFDSNNLFKFSKPTTFNNKGDEFYHSIYVKSDFFNSFEPIIDESGQVDLVGNLNNLSHDSFKKLINHIECFLNNKRNPFLLNYSVRLIEDYEKKGVCPKYEPKNVWEKCKADELRETVKTLYQIEPKIFHNLNVTQKKTFVAFISLLMDGGEAEKIFDIMSSVVELTSDERSRFCNQLKFTKLSSILKTIDLISDRYKAVEHFKKLVFDQSMYAGEVPHLQKMMEKNYWLLGEEYHLLSAAEPDFQEVLRRYSYLLRGEKDKKNISHPDKNKEMDLTIIRQNKRNNVIENIVAELKHPVNVKLGKKEFDQIYSYFNMIKSEPRFNGSNMKWKFILIGNEFDTSGYIESQLKNLLHYGEHGLAFRGDYDIYVNKWSEIFADFELRHNFINERLELERNMLIVDENLSASDIINIDFSSDSQGEIIVPPAPPSKKISSSSGSPQIRQ